MQLTLPDHLEEKLTPASAVLHLAIGLYVAEEFTMGQAAALAGISQAAFLRELGQRRIPINYGLEQLEEDLQTLGMRQR